MAVNVHSEKELKKALKAGEKEIYVYGEAAKKIAKLNKSKRLVQLLGGLGAAGLVVFATSILATPVSGGASLALSMAVADITLGKIGISLTTTEVLIIASVVGCVGVRGFEILCTKYDVITINRDNLEIKLEKKK